MRLMPAVLTLALGWAVAASADDWGEVAQISTTLGVQANRLCLGEASRGDLGCPAYTPYVNPTNGFVGIGTTQPSLSLHVSSYGLAGISVQTQNPSPTFIVGMNFLSQAGLDLFRLGTTSHVEAWQALSYNGWPIGIRSTGGVFVARDSQAHLQFTPSTTLHVSGTIRMADGGESCSVHRAGAMRWHAGSGQFQVCYGSGGWALLSSAAVSGTGGTPDRLVSGSSVATLNPSGVLTVPGRIDVVTGVGITPVGYLAGQYSSGTNLTALGYYAGRNSSANNVTAVGYAAGQINSGTALTAMGYLAGQYNSGSNLTVLGIVAGQSNSGNNVTALGAYAGQYSSGTNLTAAGYLAGRYNSGNNVTAVGYAAGLNNSSTALTALGYYAGLNSSGTNVTAVGALAGQYNSGDYLTAQGVYAAQSNSGSYVTALGYRAAQNNPSTNLTAVGYQAGQNNTGRYVTALGVSAGYNNTFDNVTLLGNNVQRASKDNQVILGDSAVVEVATSGTIVAPGLLASGVVTATYFEGDGTRLTGLPGGDRIVSGTTSIIANQSSAISFSTAGTERVVITSAGLVGIGTASPDASLTVDGRINSSWSGAADNLAIAVGGTSGFYRYGNHLLAVSNGIRVVDFATNYTMKLTSGGKLVWGYHSSLPQYEDVGIGRIAAGIVTITSGSAASSELGGLRVGHVGIGVTGTAIPSTTLHVSGTIRMADGGEACDANRAGAMRWHAGAGQFQVCYGSGGWALLSSAAVSGTGPVTDRIVSGTSSVIASQDRSVTISTAGSQRLVVGENGMVGIWTNNPQAALHVNSAIYAQSYAASGYAGSSYWNPAATSSTLSGYKNLILTTYPGQGGNILLTPDGNVGIGTSNPSRNLHLVNSTDGSATALYIASSDGGFLPGQELAVEFGQNAARFARIAGVYQNSGEWGLNFYGYRSGLHTLPTMTIHGNSNIGIGTATPDKSLTVIGDSRISGTVQVAGTGGESCGPALRGTIRQNPVSKKLEVCRY